MPPPSPSPPPPPAEHPPPPLPPPPRPQSPPPKPSARLRLRLRPAVLLPLCVVLALALTVHRRRAVLRPLRRRAHPSNPPSRKHLCFVYDRPPRTGSTTVSRAVGACMRETHAYAQPPAETRHVRDVLVPRMLALDAPRVGLFGRHVYISRQDLRDIREYCSDVFYLSSCRPVRERIWSVAKYAVSRSGNANTTVDGDRLERAMQRYMANDRAEAFLERYPYVTIDGLPNDVPNAEMIVPDYIIRADHMEHDLALLLDALQCGTAFKSGNVHAGASGNDMLLRKALKLGDASYQRLKRLAETRNEEGLRKAKRFVPQTQL